jgi:dTDP-4-dehydrorhamnose 3,5-epimerase
MKIIELELPGVLLLEPKYFEDFRGYYSETYSARTLKEYGIETVFVQDNHSFSLKKGTIRGIHFQNEPKPQTKLVRCTRGRIMDFAVDLRRRSPNYKKWVGVELSAENRKQIWIPRGFGHGFVTLEDNCEVQYKVDEFYYPEFDRAIAWHDPEIGISLGLNNPIVSKKDIDAPLLCDSDINFVMESNK